MSNAVFDHKQVLGRLAGFIDQEKECVSVIYPSTQSESREKITSTLDSALTRTSEMFKVLIVGHFSSGKTSMINALIGEELLPTGALPETAVIGELRYSDTKRIVLYPKKGEWEGGDEPFELEKATPEEIEKYVSLNADESVNSFSQQDEYQEAIGQTVTNTHIVSKFEKMVIYWPLEILKDGVVLIDSPGLNDPYGNDVIVNKYLPQVDAIVYLTSGMMPYSGLDQEELHDINAAGYRNIMSGCTFYDVVVLSYKNKTAKLEEFREKLIEQMSKHTDLGIRSIHFLSNTKALEAKQEGDEQGLVRSGFKGFEDFLAHYLVESKGRDQVRNVASTIILEGQKMIKDSASLDSASDMDIAQLNAKVEADRARLDDIRMRSVEYGRIFRMSLESHLPEIRRLIEEFVYNMADNVDLEGFQPINKLPTGPRKLWPWGERGVRHLAGEIQKECQRELEHRLNIELKKWCNSELNIRIKKIITQSVEKVKPGITKIAEDLQSIRADISGVKASDIHGDVGNIALGLAYAFLTGDWFTGGMSAVYGKGAMGRAIGFQVGAGLAMGILASLGVVISFPVFLVTAIGASILAILTNDNEKQIAKIKVQAVSDVRKSFKAATKEAESMRADIVNAVMKNVKSLIEDACSDMEDALKADVKAEEDIISQVISASSADAATKKKQIHERAECVKRLEDIESQIFQICEGYGLGRDFLQVKAS